MRLRHPSLAIVIVFVTALAPILFANNEGIGVISGQFVDSGSLLSSYREMLAAGTFNQNVHYHTNIYGWPINNLIVWLFWIFDVVRISDQAVLARATSLVLSAGCILLLGALLGFSVLNSFCLLLAATWPPFVALSVQVHPEPAGMFLALVSLLALGSEREGKIYVSFFAAVLSFLCKQPFIIYLIPPLYFAACEIYTAPKIKRVRLAARFFGGFVIIALAAISIRNTYALIDLPGFIRSQVLVHSELARISYPVSTAAFEWTKLIAFHEPWLALSILASCYAVRISKSHLVVACAIVNIAFLPLLIIGVKFLFVRSYLYPVIPTSAVVVVAMLSPFFAVMSWGKRIVMWAAVAIASATIVINATRSVGGVISAVEFRETPGSILARSLYGPASKGLLAVFSYSIPLFDGTFSRQIGSAALGTDIRQALIAMKPDMIVVDVDWPYAEADKFAAAAVDLELTKILVTIHGTAQQCNFGDGFLSSVCLPVVTDWVTGKARKTEKHYAIYGNQQSTPVIESLRKDPEIRVYLWGHPA